MGKGWERASIEFNTRPDKFETDFRPTDLMVPTVIDGSLWKLAAMCVACGTMLSLLWLWPILTMAAILGLNAGTWFYPIIAAAALAAAAALFVFSSWDFERVERSGREA